MADLEISPALKDARAAQWGTVIDSGSGVAYLHFYTNPQPAPGAAAGPAVLLGTGSFDVPSVSVIPGTGVADLDFATDPQAIESGDVGWGRIVNRNGDWVADLKAGITGSGKPLQLDSLTVQAGAFLVVTSASIAEP